MFWGMKDTREILAELKVKRDSLMEQVGLAEEVVRLKREIAALQIDRSKITEDHAREDRELRHMIGLERKRQEVEVQQAKRDSVLTVREENLAADKQRFEEQMKFHQDRFQAEVGYLKELMGQILNRLPNVEVNVERT